MLLLRRLLILTLLLVLIALGAGYFLLRGSLPQIDGTVASPELSAPVLIERDALGTATLQAQNRRDLAFALGYLHGQERFFQMDLMRRQAAGELAELVGSAAVPADRKARAHRMRALAGAALVAMPADDRALVDAYCDGVNAGLAALAVRPFPYLLLGATPAPWRSEDTILAVDAMYFTLNDAENRRELGFSYLKAALPESAYRFLAATGGPWDAPLAGPPMQWPDPPSAADLDIHALDPQLLHEQNHLHHRDKVPGSNGFAVAGALTGGAALVANDMHLDLRVPDIWFRARFVYPDPRRAGETTDVTGATLPGTPAMVVGSNRKIAWGFTNSYADAADWVRVVLDPHDPTRYRTADGWKPLTIRKEIIHVRDAPDQTLEIRDTEWGPIIAKDADGTPLALAWTAQQPGAVNLELMRLEQAETADEAVAIAQRAGMPAQNFVVGDRNGNIAWTIAGRMPKRVGDYDPLLPADWSRPDTGWDGWLDPHDYPLIANPPWQRLWTANQRTMEDPWLKTMGDGGYDLGARARQIRDDLKAHEHFAPADMLAVQLDDRALFLERWKDLLGQTLNRAPASPLADKMKRAIADWSGHASIDSVGYRLVRAWRNEVIDTVLDGFAAAVRRKFPDFTIPHLPQAESAVWTLLRERPQNLLPPGYKDWDDLLARTAERVGERLDRQPGGLAARTWGERNTTRIDNPLARALPAFLARYIDMPAEELPGDRDMPRVQAPAFGASERFAVAPGDEAHGYFEMPAGQSGHPLSPYFGAGHEDWARGRPTPFLPGPPVHELRMTPERAGSR